MQPPCAQYELQSRAKLMDATGHAQPAYFACALNRAWGCGALARDDAMPSEAGRPIAPLRAAGGPEDGVLRRSTPEGLYIAFWKCKHRHSTRAVRRENACAKLACMQTCLQSSGRDLPFFACRTLGIACVRVRQTLTD